MFMGRVTTEEPPGSPFEVRRNARGRPKLTMTPLRAEVLDEVRKCQINGEHLTLAEIARRCRLTHYRNARRIVNDLKEMGHEL